MIGGKCNSYLSVKCVANINDYFELNKFFTSIKTASNGFTATIILQKESDIFSNATYWKSISYLLLMILKAFTKNDMKRKSPHNGKKRKKIKYFADLGNNAIFAIPKGKLYDR